jgi:signal transduction histidine kinase
LVLISKEAINNAVKYSGAKNVIIRIQCQQRLIEVVIEDDGIGIDNTVINSRGNGMINMQKRTEELNGKFEIISTKDAGTKIIAKIPIP